MKTKKRYIYHLLTKNDWRKAKEEGAYKPTSLKEVGFIHCSTKDQVVETANRRFSGTENLLLLVIDSEKVEAKIVYEDIKNIGEEHPHIYGPLSLNSVEFVLEMLPSKQGKFAFPWKKISSKTVLKHTRLTVVEDTVELPDGIITDYLRFESRGNAATIICQRKDGKFLMQEEYSYPVNKKLIQFPGGWVPKEEDLVAGAEREFIEETGYKPKEIKLIGSYLINNRRTNARMYVYMVNGVVKDKQKLDCEEKGIRNIWLSEKKFTKLIRSGFVENHHTLASWALLKVY